MRAGIMDRRIELQQKTVIQDTYGEEIETWKKKATIWAGKRDFRGKEFFAAQQLNAEVSGVFCIRYRPDITPDDHRIIYDGKTYDIKAVTEFGRREGLQLMVEARFE